MKKLITELKDWDVTYYNKKNKPIKMAKIKNKTEKEAIDKIVNGDKPNDYHGFMLTLDEPDPFKS